MRRAAGFDSDDRRFNAAEERDQFTASKLPLQARLFCGVDTMKLEDLLRRIHSYADNLVHVRSSQIHDTVIVPQRRHGRAVHTIRLYRRIRRA